MKFHFGALDKTQLFFKKILINEIVNFNFTRDLEAPPFEGDIIVMGMVVDFKVRDEIDISPHDNNDKSFFYHS